MSRDGGFERADIASGYFDDPKVRKLWRIVNDESTMTRAVAIHMAVVLGSWREGRRIAAVDAAPFWLDWTAARETLDALRRAGLLDSQGRVPKRSWESWYGPAIARRHKARESGAEGARRRWGPNGAAIGSRSPTSQPTNQPTIARGRARETAVNNGGMTTFQEAMEASGIKLSIKEKREARERENT